MTNLASILELSDFTSEEMDLVTQHINNNPDISFENMNEAWRNENGVLCVSYEIGKWYRYNMQTLKVLCGKLVVFEGGQKKMGNIRIFDLYNGDIVIFFGEDYCHDYNKGNIKQIGEDVAAYKNGSNPEMWDGNEIEHFALEEFENDGTVEELSFVQLLSEMLDLTEDKVELLIDQAKTYDENAIKLYKYEAGWEDWMERFTSAGDGEIPSDEEIEVIEELQELIFTAAHYLALTNLEQSAAATTMEKEVQETKKQQSEVSL